MRKCRLEHRYHFSTANWTQLKKLTPSTVRGGIEPLSHMFYSFIFERERERERDRERQRETERDRETEDVKPGPW